MIEPADGEAKHSVFATTVIIIGAAILLTALVWLQIDSNPFGPPGP